MESTRPSLTCIPTELRLEIYKFAVLGCMKDGFASDIASLYLSCHTIRHEMEEFIAPIRSLLQAKHKWEKDDSSGAALRLDPGCTYDFKKSPTSLEVSFPYAQSFIDVPATSTGTSESPNRGMVFSQVCLYRLEKAPDSINKFAKVLNLLLDDGAQRLVLSMYDLQTGSLVVTNDLTSAMNGRVMGLIQSFAHTRQIRIENMLLNIELHIALTQSTQSTAVSRHIRHEIDFEQQPRDGVAMMKWKVQGLEDRTGSRLLQFGCRVRFSST